MEWPEARSRAAFAGTIRGLPDLISNSHETYAYILAARNARVMPRFVSLPEFRGRRECRVLAAPMARLQQKMQAAEPQVQPGPAFPAQWF
jgi:hypothetical protein